MRTSPSSRRMAGVFNARCAHDPGRQLQSNRDDGLLEGLQGGAPHDSPPWIRSRQPSWKSTRPCGKAERGVPGGLVEMVEMMEPPSLFRVIIKEMGMMAIRDFGKIMSTHCSIQS